MADAPVMPLLAGETTEDRENDILRHDYPVKPDNDREKSRG